MDFEPDDLVWAKMKGYPPWPGKIMVPPDDAKSKPKKSHYYVFFFGSENYAWIPNDCIELHSEKFIQKYGNRKGSLFQTAVETIVKGSKGFSKYNRTKESVDPLDNENASKAKEHAKKIDKFANDDAQSKSKSPQSNSTPPKIKKKIPIKKVSSVKILTQEKPIRKRKHSSDQEESDNYSDCPSEDTYAHSSEPSGSAPIKFTIDDLGYSLPDTICRLPLPPPPPPSPPPPREYYERPDTPPMDLMQPSEAMLKKKIEPTKKKIGVLGSGKLWQGVTKNLYHSGHSLIIWNQTINELEMFPKKFKMIIGETPAAVVKDADIIFCCFSDSDGSKDFSVWNNEILEEMQHSTGERKGYIDLTSMYPDASQAMASSVRMKGGRYLEAPYCGSRIEISDGTLLIVTAGDKTLYDDSKSCLDAISKEHMFVSAEVGYASKLNTLHNMLIGTVYASLAESLALVTEVQLKGEDFLDILKVTDLDSDSLSHKVKSMIKKDYTTDVSLKQVQQDINLGLSLGHEMSQRSTIFAAANEVYKRCIAMKYGEHDVGAVFEGTRP